MLTPEQKKTVADWMGWKAPDTIVCNHCIDILHPFDPNDAALCVKVMKRRRCWMEFFVFSRKLSVLSDSWSLTITYDDFVVWLMTTKSGEAVNFFSAMAEWIEVDGKCINNAK